MTQYCRKSVLVVGVLALLAGGSALAQDLETMEGFAAADISSYGSGPQPKQGYFFAFDGLFWSIGRPNTAPIGRPGLVRETVYNTGYPILDENEQVIGLVRPQILVQENSHDTGPLESPRTMGNRIEFGRVYGHKGWMFSGFQLKNQNQFYEGSNVDVTFLDLPYTDSLGWERYHLQGYSGAYLGNSDDGVSYEFGDGNPPEGYYIVDLPITFDEMYVRNRAEIWGVELMYLSRMGQTWGNGFLELFAGVRYLEFKDTFDIQLLGTERTNSDGDPITTAAANARFDYDSGPDGDPTTTTPAIIGPGSVLADSMWTSTAQNHIVGPQIGGRWFRKQGRWTVAVEGRFLAGLNLQDIRNTGVLGDKLDQPTPWTHDVAEGEPTMLDLFMPFQQRPYYFDHVAHIREWSPGGEVRLEAVFDLTRSVNFKVGWNGMWMGGIARGNTAADYVISNDSTMGVDRGRNDQVLFVNGLTVGLTVNR